ATSRRAETRGYSTSQSRARQSGGAPAPSIPRQPPDFLLRQRPAEHAKLVHTSLEILRPLVEQVAPQRPLIRSDRPARVLPGPLVLLHSVEIQRHLAAGRAHQREVVPVPVIGVHDGSQGGGGPIEWAVLADQGLELPALEAHLNDCLQVLAAA